MAKKSEKVQDEQKAEVQEEQVPLYQTQYFPYVSAQAYAISAPFKTVSKERAEALFAKAKEQDAEYAAYKNGKGVPGYIEAVSEELLKEAVEADRALNEALVRSKEARKALQQKTYAFFEEACAETGQSMRSLIEGSKREGQRIACAAMVQAFPELAEHPKYQNVAAGEPTKDNVVGPEDNDEGEEEEGAGEDDK